MSHVLILLPVLAVLVIVLFQASRRVRCPDCDALLPVLVSPFEKTQRMWRAGGYLCERCGCETDTAGRKVTADTPAAPFPLRQWALCGVLLLVGCGLAASLLTVGPAAAAVPPLVVVPQSAVPDR